MYNKKGIEEVVAILMRREQLSREDASNWVKEALDMVMDAISEGNYIEAEDIWQDEVGLEPDYLLNILM